MKKKGFTLIELLAVIIILAVIALIATPIILNVVDNAKESARQSSISGYADATRLSVTEYQFGHDGQTPKLDQAFIDTIKPQGSTVTCENVIYSNDYGVVLNKCTVVPDTKEYCFAQGKTFVDCNDASFQDIYNNANNEGTKSIVSNISDECAKNGSTCTIEQIKKGVFMDVKVNDIDTYKFYVLSDDGTNVTLLMDRNLDLDGNGTPNDKVAWQRSGNNVDGPITVLTALENYTNAWINISNMNYNLIGTNATDNNGCNLYNTCTTNTYNISERTNVKARLPRNQELVAIGCTDLSGSCPTWAYDYLNGRPNPILGVYAYWTSTAYASDSQFAWLVSNAGNTLDSSRVVNGIIYYSDYGVRPVITISKSNIK